MITLSDFDKSYESIVVGLSERMVFDDSQEKRIAVAKYYSAYPAKQKELGEFLDILVYDQAAYVRRAVAKQGRDKDLDILINDSSIIVLKEILDQGRPQDLMVLMGKQKKENPNAVLLPTGQKIDWTKELQSQLRDGSLDTLSIKAGKKYEQWLALNAASKMNALVGDTRNDEESAPSL